MRATRSEQHGFALVIVLWAAVLMSLIAASLIGQSRIAARIERNEWRRLDTDAAADAAFNHAMVFLMSRAEANSPLLTRVRLTAEVLGEPVEFWFEDETGKIDLNEADEGLLTRGFRAAGYRGDRAGALAAAIVEWRSADRQHDSGTSGSAAVFQRFQSVEELLLVNGFDEQMLMALRPVFTVHAQASSVNLDVAARPVLEALLDRDRAGVEVILKNRRLATEIALRPERDLSIRADPSALTGKAITVTVAFRRYDLDYRRQQIVRFTGQARRPIMVLSRS